MAHDWIRLKKGEYRNADNTQRLFFAGDAGCWWAAPVRKPGERQSGYSLSELRGPYAHAALAGTLDAPPELGDWTFRVEDQ